MNGVIDFEGKTYYGGIHSHNGCRDMYILLFEDKDHSKLIREFNLGMLEISFGGSYISIFGLAKEGNVYKPYNFYVTEMVT